MQMKYEGEAVIANMRKKTTSAMLCFTVKTNNFKRVDFIVTY